jgi:hypothetical protein
MSESRVRENRMPGLTGGRWRSSSHGEPESMHLLGNRRD